MLVAGLSWSTWVSGAEFVVVVPAGAESQVQRALGLGLRLAGGCALGDVNIDRERIDASYACEGRSQSVHVHVTYDSTNERSAFSSAQNDAPPVLLEALRARGSDPSLRIPWKRSSIAPPPPPPSDETRSTNGGAPSSKSASSRMWRWIPALVFAWGATLATLRLRGRAGVVSSACFGAAVAISTLFSLHAASDALVLATAHLTAPALGRAGWVLFATLVMLVGTFFYRRSTYGARSKSVAMGAAAMVCLLQYVWTLHRLRSEPGVPELAGVPAARAPGIYTEPYPGRPNATYAIGPHGFRGPPWAKAPAAGTFRVVLIGDSFVYGSGVEWADTLGESLALALRTRKPEQSFEVLNLGVPGNNLPSHVDMTAAASSLEPQAIVVCLTLPNDLSDVSASASSRQPRALAKRALGIAFLGEAMMGWSTHAGELATNYDNKRWPYCGESSRGSAPCGPPTRTFRCSSSPTQPTNRSSWHRSRRSPRAR